MTKANFMEMGKPIFKNGGKLKKDNTVWGEIESRKEATNCETCHIKIWKTWHTASSLVHPMRLCGPCFFENKNEYTKI